MSYQGGTGGIWVLRLFALLMIGQLVGLIANVGVAMSDNWAVLPWKKIFTIGVVGLLLIVVALWFMSWLDRRAEKRGRKIRGVPGLLSSNDQLFGDYGGPVRSGVPPRDG